MKNITRILALDGMFVFKYCNTLLRPSNKNLVKLESSSSIPCSKHFKPYVIPAKSDAIAAVFCGVQPVGNRSGADASILELPAVSLSGIGVSP